MTNFKDACANALLGGTAIGDSFGATIDTLGFRVSSAIGSFIDLFSD